MSAALIEEIAARGLVAIDLQRGRFRIHRDAYRDPAIFQREQELIFAKC